MSSSIINPSPMMIKLHPFYANVLKLGLYHWAISVKMTKLTASNGAAFDYFGGSVSLSGYYALIGANGDDSTNVEQGAAYVYFRSATIWNQQAKLVAFDAGANDYFGYAVCLVDDYALIGAYGDDVSVADQGSAYVFLRSGSDWNQQAKLVAADGSSGSEFGYAVSLSGDYALIGASGDDVVDENQGSAYVFHRSSTTWSEEDKLLATDGVSGDVFGESVSLDGDYALVGSYSNDAPNANQGAAYVFFRVATTWDQQAKLTASDGAAGDFFGDTVALDGDYALIGSPYSDSPGANQGSAYVFLRSGSDWTQQAKLLASDGAIGDQFGLSVSIAGDYAMIGALIAAITQGEGVAYVFLRSGTNWDQQDKLVVFDGPADETFGSVSSMSGDYALIGAYSDNSSFADQGASYLFYRNGADWSFACPTGTSINDVSCDACVAGKYNDMVGQSACYDCGEGKYNDQTGQTGCMNCGAGAYNDQMGQTSCTDCAMGKYTDQISVSICMDCGMGKYNDQMGQASCTDCAAGTYNTQTGSTSSSACVDCAVGKCGPYAGATSSESGCGDCGIGKYNDQTGQSACTQCVTGKYTNQMGQTSCTECETGRSQDQVGSTACNLCNVGTYQDATGQTSCVDCAAGTYNSMSGQATCTDCAEGKYNTLTGQIGCMDCGYGTYNGQTGSASSSDCMDCAMGTYSDQMGQATCTDCGEGKYNDMTGQLSCFNCGAGTYNPSTASVSSAACVNCAAGKYSDTTGMSSCTDCSTGKYNSMTGQTSCNDCGAGMYNDQVGQGICTDCVTGTYNDQTGSTSSSACMDCGTGTYNAMTGQESCMNCGTGKYNDQTGSTSSSACMDCVMGMYNDMTGQASCMDCGADTYADMTGSTTCTACMDGTCTDGATGSNALTACVPCDDDDGSGLLERTTIIGLSLMTLIMMWA